MRTVEISRIESSPAPRLSALLALAVEDLDAVSSDPGYVYDSAVWHSAGDPDTHRSPLRPCRVCAAGAVLARHFGVPPDATFDNTEDARIPAWMLAIDRAREGHLSTAAGLFYGLDDPTDVFIHTKSVRAPTGIQSASERKDSKLRWPL